MQLIMVPGCAPTAEKWMKVLRAEEIDGVSSTEKGNYFELFVIQEDEGIKLQLATSWSTTQEVQPSLTAAPRPHVTEALLTAVF